MFKYRSSPSTCHIKILNKYGFILSLKTDERLCKKLKIFRTSKWLIFQFLTFYLHFRRKFRNLLPMINIGFFENSFHLKYTK